MFLKWLSELNRGFFKAIIVDFLMDHQQNNNHGIIEDFQRYNREFLKAQQQNYKRGFPKGFPELKSGIF